MAEYIAKTCNFSQANGPYEGHPYDLPKPTNLPYHPQGFIMTRTDYDYSQINHFCPQCSSFFTPAHPNTLGPRSYSCEGGRCVTQQRAPGPGYYANMNQCQQNCPSVPAHHQKIPPHHNSQSNGGFYGPYVPPSNMAGYR
jgi:hypothetical protein